MSIESAQTNQTAAKWGTALTPTSATSDIRPAPSGQDLLWRVGSRGEQLQRLLRGREVWSRLVLELHAALRLPAFAQPFVTDVQSRRHPGRESGVKSPGVVKSPVFAAVEEQQQQPTAFVCTRPTLNLLNQFTQSSQSFTAPLGRCQRSRQQSAMQVRQGSSAAGELPRGNSCNRRVYRVYVRSSESSRPG
jgi:hypothetical protein